MFNDFNTCTRNRKYFGKNKNSSKFLCLRMTHLFFNFTRWRQSWSPCSSGCHLGPFRRFVQNVLQGAKRGFQPCACEIGALSATEILPKVFLHFSVLCSLLLNCLERCTDLILISLYKHSVNYFAQIQPGIMSCFHQSSAQILNFKMHSW